MMKDKVIVGLFLCAGAGLALVGGGSAVSQAEEREMNPLELKGSPFGEVLGMALQDPIHMAWHGGQGHDHVILPGEDEHTPDGEICEVCGVDHGDDREHGAVVGVDLHRAQTMPVFLKGKVGLLGKFVRQKNSPHGTSAALRRYEVERTKNLLQTAYDFDRTNYGNYNAMNFFYVTNEERGGESVGDALALAEETLKACAIYKDRDPQDALTAASAAENILVWKYAIRDRLSAVEIVEAYQLFQSEVMNYQAVIEEALESGRLAYYSPERLKEMEGRFGTFSYALREYKKKVDAMPRIIRAKSGFRAKSGE